MARGSYEWKAEDLETTPSQRDGFSKKQEKVWRRRYCLLIDRAAKTIPVGFAPAQTAMSYCHRYFAVRSMTRNGPQIIATAALYLACKVEEQPKSVVTVMEAVYKVVYGRKPTALAMLKNTEFAAKLKERVLIAERSMLYVLGFDFELEHPTQVALDFLQANYNFLLPEELRVDADTWAEECAAQSGPSYDLMNQLSIVVWNLCLSSYQMPRFLLYEAHHVAAAAIFVAIQMMQLRPITHNGWHWFELPPLNVTLPTLKEIVAGILEVYERPEEKPREGPRLAAQRGPNRGGPAPASDPRSDLSEQTQQSPGGTPKVPGQSPRQEPSKPSDGEGRPLAKGQ